MNPFPTARTIIHNNEEEISAKIYDIRKENEEHNLESGKIIATKKYLKVAVKGGFLFIDTIQTSGKRKMDSMSLLNGLTFHSNAKMM